MEPIQVVHIDYFCLHLANIGGDQHTIFAKSFYYLCDAWISKQDILFTYSWYAHIRTTCNGFPNINIISSLSVTFIKCHCNFKPISAEARIFRQKWVKTKISDTIVSSFARSPAALVMTKLQVWLVILLFFIRKVTRSSSNDYASSLVSDTIVSSSARSLETLVMTRIHAWLVILLFLHSLCHSQL